MLAHQLFEPDPRPLKTEASEVGFLQIWMLDDSQCRVHVCLFHFGPDV